MKKLGAGIVVAAAFAALMLLAIALYLQPEERRFLRFERVQDLLRPYPWVKSRADAPGVSFTLFGKAGFLELTGPGERHFEFDPDAFVRAQGASSFREAQLKYFSAREFDPGEARYRRVAPQLTAWGPLPYPPLRTFPKSWKREEGGSFAKTFLADPAYESKLDELTGSELTVNEGLELYQNGTAFPLLERMASSAKKFVFLNVLSLTCDPSTEKLIGILEAKGRAKTDVRLLIHKWFARLDTPCLDRLRAAGVSVVLTQTHSSYLINDQGEAAIGSESIARMFARSDGYNRLDRDLMLWVKGPLATDLLQDFISVWEASRDEGDRVSSELVKLYKQRKAAEVERGLRGPSNYPIWLQRAEPRGLCRLATQKPGGHDHSLTDLLVSLTQAARKGVFASGNDIGPSAVITALRAKASAGTPVDLLVNGYESGNGELTMVLDEWIDDLEARGRSRTARALELLRDHDRRSLARRRARDVRELTSAPGLQAWAHFGFMHYKAWVFDHYGVWIGSANPDQRAQEKLYEAGALCLDGRLARQFAESRAIDLANSVPYVSLLAH